MAAVEQLLSIGIQLVAHLADFSQRNGWLIRTTEDSLKRKIDQEHISMVCTHYVTRNLHRRLHRFTNILSRWFAIHHFDI
jgi:hypothetical protein